MHVIFGTNNNCLPKIYTIIQTPIRKKSFFIPSFPFHFIHVATYLHNQNRSPEYSYMWETCSIHVKTNEIMCHFCLNDKSKHNMKRCHFLSTIM